MINKAKSFLKKNIGICIMSGVIICGAITTTMLVKFIPNPHFVINELSISGGPNYRNQDQSLVLKVNIPSNEHSNNDNYICEALGESIDGGKLKTTSLGQPYVS
jgi:hypothetical protein